MVYACARLPLVFAITFLAIGCWLLPIANTFAQERCGTVAYEKMIHGTGHETEKQFEDWLREKINTSKLVRTLGSNRTESIYTIPVVVHVIHNGEAYGSGTNIPDEQIASQIQVLNDDYNRLNVDQSNTPAEFLPAAGSISIQFVLAKQDPEGVATNGITRTQGTKTAWTIDDNSQVKALSYWPAENYLNIWVMNLTGGLIGIAQLPVSSQLQGLEDSSTDRLTDGVMINYRDFGSIDGGSFILDASYNKGRTATHEVGHFLGLRHIWGDGNCATDYVADTPSQPSSTSGCPSGSQNVTCSDGTHHKMYQNYMDYTSDACMNLFTKNQIDRMVVVLGNSPRRKSLLTSPGATTPTPVPNDAGIRQILSPQTSVCKSNIVPQLEIRNYGTNNVTSVQIRASINGTSVETKTFLVSLAPLAKTTVSFNNVMNFVTGSSQNVSFQILQTNIGPGPDDNTNNDTMTVSVSVPATTSLPILESFNTLPPGWQVLNPDGQITWANVTAPDANASNKAMYMDFNDYQNDGVLDWLITPSFTLGNPATSQLKFNRAYAQFPGESADELLVYALPSCSQDLSQAILLYDASGATLATAGSTSSPFTPNSASQWKTQVKSLSTLSSSISYQLAFVAKNGYGNNLYVDRVIVSDQEVNDVAITGIVSPGPVHCSDKPSIKFSLKNLSTAVITTFDVVTTLNGGAPVTQTMTVTLDLDEEKTITLSPITLRQGENSIALTVNNPNGLPDSSPANNALNFNSYLDQSTDASPLRLTFDNPLEVPWIMATPETNAQKWETITTPRKKTSAVYKAFSNTTLDEESWLVSPVLDLSRYSQQNLFFDLSYALRYPREDRLKIFASTDCGLTYDKLLFDQSGSSFQDSTLISEWLPPSEKYWRREVVSLDSVSGINNVRLAFVAVNENGNNIYLDNIEIFAGTDVSPPVSTLAYQLYYPTRFSQYDVALTFTLPEKKDVRLQIFTVMGQLVADNALPDTLNQTYYFDLSTQSAGIYLFRLQMDDQVSTTKVFIGH